MGVSTVVTPETMIADIQRIPALSRNGSLNFTKTETGRAIVSVHSGVEPEWESQLQIRVHRRQPQLCIPALSRNGSLNFGLDRLVLA